MTTPFTYPPIPDGWYAIEQGHVVMQDDMVSFNASAWDRVAPDQIGRVLANQYLRVIRDGRPDRNAQTPQMRLKALLDQGILAAWADGKAIQARKADTLEDWHDIATDDPNWTVAGFKWRIRPEPPPEPTRINWIAGEPPRVEGVSYLVWLGRRAETVQWDAGSSVFRRMGGNEWYTGLKWWAPMCNCPMGDK